MAKWRDWVPDFLELVRVDKQYAELAQDSLPLLLRLV